MHSVRVVDCQVLSIFQGYICIWIIIYHSLLYVLMLYSENKRLPPQQSGCAPIPWDNTDKAEKGRIGEVVRLCYLI